MGRKRGEIENWLRRIVFGGKKSEYVIYVRFRVDGEEVLRPIPGELIDDLRGGYMYVKDDIIPIHRVAEIRDRNNRLLYRRI